MPVRSYQLMNAWSAVKEVVSSKDRGQLQEGLSLEETLPEV